MTRFATVLLLALLGMLAAAAPGRALTLGSTKLPTGSSLSGACNTASTGPSTFDLVQTGTEGKFDYRVPPGGGAIDSWSFNTSGATAGTPYALVVARGSGAGGTFSIVGSDVETVPPSPPPAATFTLTPPIAVRAGDVLGFEAFPTTTASCLFENGPLTAADVVAGGGPSGDSVDLTPDFRAHW